MHKTSQQRLKQGERERERERNSLESTHRGSETEESKSSSKQQNKKLMERTPFISPNQLKSPLHQYHLHFNSYIAKSQNLNSKDANFCLKLT